MFTFGEGNVEVGIELEARRKRAERPLFNCSRSLHGEASDLTMWGEITDGEKLLY